MVMAELERETRRDIYHVAVVDDEPGMRLLLSRLFEAAGFPTRAYPSAEALLEDDENVRFGCIVLDIALTGISGLDLQAELRRRCSDVPIVMISGKASVSEAIRAFDEQASAFFEKPFDNHAILSKVRQLLADWTTKQRKRDAAQAKLLLLSPREKEVLELLVAGKTTVQIAHALEISSSTVEKHRIHIFEKTGEDSVIGLIRLLSL